jgi:hypothetical protein
MMVRKREKMKLLGAVMWALEGRMGSLTSAALRKTRVFHRDLRSVLGAGFPNIFPTYSPGLQLVGVDGSHTLDDEDDSTDGAESLNSILDEILLRMGAPKSKVIFVVSSRRSDLASNVDIAFEKKVEALAASSGKKELGALRKVRRA